MHGLMRLSLLRWHFDEHMRLQIGHDTLPFPFLQVPFDVDEPVHDILKVFRPFVAVIPAAPGILNARIMLEQCLFDERPKVWGRRCQDLKIGLARNLQPRAWLHLRPRRARLLRGTSTRTIDATHTNRTTRTTWASRAAWVGRWARRWSRCGG